VHPSQTIQQFLVTDFVLVEEIMTIFIDRYTEVLAFSLRLTRNARWQVHLDPFMCTWLKLTIMKLASKKT